MSGRYARTGESVRGGFAFALLALFALLSLLIVLVGARVYRAVNDAGERNYVSRTAVSYIAGKVRASDAKDAVRVIEGGGAPVLLLAEDVDGTAYGTYIFYRDGSVCEYVGALDDGFDPALGEPVVAANGFTASLAGRTLSFAVTDTAGTEHALRLVLRAAGEANP